MRHYNIFISLISCIVILVLAASCLGQESKIDSVKVRNELNNILSAPEYNRKYVAEDNQDDFISRFSERISNAIARFFAWLARVFMFDRDSPRNAMSKTLIFLIVIFFIILSVILFKRIINSRIFIRVGTNRDAGAPLSYDLPASQKLIIDAERHAQAGDYRNAFRCAYLALIAALDEADIIRFDRSRTNWEYLRELKNNNNDTAYSLLRPITILFDRKFYGREQCSRQDYLDVKEIYNQLKKEAA